MVGLVLDLAHLAAEPGRDAMEDREEGEVEPEQDEHEHASQGDERAPGVRGDGPVVLIDLEYPGAVSELHRHVGLERPDVAAVASFGVEMRDATLGLALEHLVELARVVGHGSR